VLSAGAAVLDQDVALASDEVRARPKMVLSAALINQAGKAYRWCAESVVR
jgi:hypothetical protein